MYLVFCFYGFQVIHTKVLMVGGVFKRNDKLGQLSFRQILTIFLIILYNIYCFYSVIYAIFYLIFHNLCNKIYLKENTAAVNFHTKGGLLISRDPYPDF